jgi:hypothetical protein
MHFESILRWSRGTTHFIWWGTATTLSAALPAAATTATIPAATTALATTAWSTLTSATWSTTSARLPGI